LTAVFNSIKIGKSFRNNKIQCSLILLPHAIQLIKSREKKSRNPTIDERISEFWRRLKMSSGYLTYRPGDMIPVNEELLDKFETYRGDRSQAQTMRDILCAALGVQLSRIDLSYGHKKKINARIATALEKERNKRRISKRETVRQLVREQLDKVNGI
jgi:hypothetical protein